MSQSYSSLFGTNGSGLQNRIGSLFGQSRTQTSGTNQQNPQQPRPQQTPTYQQTFAQMQQQGQARPAPPQAPQAGTYSPYQGSQQAQAARAPMLTAVQQQLQNPTRFDTQAFQQIRQAQQGNLNAEFGAQRSQLEEEMARRGLSASSIGAGRYGDLAGQQARAQATLDADLLSQAAQTQAADRLAALQAAGQFADLAGSQDLAEFEANRVGQAQQFQEGLQSAQFGQNQSEFDRTQALQAANLEQTGGLSGMELALREQLGLGELGVSQAQVAQQGQIAEADIGLRAQQLQQQAALEGRSLDLTQARDLATQQLEQSRLSQQGNQFGQQLGLDRERLSQQGNQFTQELEMRARQLQQEAAQFGENLSLDQARLAAQQEQFGQSMGLDRDRLSQQGSQFDMEQRLREQLGLGDLDVRRQQATADTQLAQNQLMLQLAQALGGLSPDMLRALFGGGAGTSGVGGGGTVGGGGGQTGGTTGPTRDPVR